MRRTIILAAFFLAFGGANAAAAGKPNYVFDGGSGAERAQAAAALKASTFNWGIVRARVTIHIVRANIPETPGYAPGAVPGQIWLYASLLDAGMFSWGVVQHEYAHEVDYLVLDDQDRQALYGLLGGSTWCCFGDGQAGLHSDYTGEIFATSVAWAYWPSRNNVMRPASKRDEGGEVPAARFRSFLNRLLAAKGLTAQLPAKTR